MCLFWKKSSAYSSNFVPHWLSNVGSDVSTQYNVNITDSEGAIVGVYLVKSQFGFIWNSWQNHMVSGGLSHTNIMSALLEPKL